MISTPHRQTATMLIEDAVTAGVQRAKACAELEISDRTLRRWTKDGQLGVRSGRGQNSTLSSSVTVLATCTRP